MSLGLLAVFASQFANVSPTNFGGTDEWLYIDLASRGVLGIPYANRPLVLLWTLPAARLIPHDLLSYYLIHGAWLFLAGWLTYLLVGRLLPSWPMVWYLAATITLVWAPADFLRLNCVLLSGYSGFTFGALAAVLLFLDSWFRRSWALLALSGVVAALTGRGFEGTIPLMAGAPVLLLWLEKDRSRTLLVWVVAWWSLLAGLAGVAAWAFLARASQGSYQVSGLGYDPHPLRVASRILEQFGYHLFPLVRVTAGELRPAAVPSVALFLASFALALRLSRARPPAPDGRRELGGTVVLGVLLAALGYSALMLSPSILKAARTQFLSGPGIAVALAAAAGLLSTWLPERGRHAALALFGAWIVALGGSRTLALQQEWDEVWDLYPAQRASLKCLTLAAPHLAPHTFVILLDGTRAWPASFGYRHALSYLYEGRAKGQVWGALDFLYPMRVLPEGVRSDPWPSLGRAWGERRSLYRYDEVVVVREQGDGGCEVLEEWPPDLGPLPSGASYAPRSRIEVGGALPASRAILRRGPR